MNKEDKVIDWSQAEDYHTHYIEDLSCSRDSGFHVVREGIHGIAYYESNTSDVHYLLDIADYEGYTVTERPKVEDGLPPVGFTFKFMHEFEEGYAYLNNNHGWEDAIRNIITPPKTQDEENIEIMAYDLYGILTLEYDETYCKELAKILYTQGYRKVGK